VLFIFKKPKLVLDFFTTEQYVYDNNKIDYAHKFYPEWWKNTPKYMSKGVGDAGTIKKCIGLIETFKTGIMIPLWADLSMRIQNNSCQYQFADYKTNISQHTPEEWNTYADDVKFIHIKIITPWKCKSKSDTKFYFTAPTWNHPLDVPYKILSGVVDYKYQYATNINMMVDVSTANNLVINQSTPMAHLIPLTDKEVIVKNHLVDEKEFNKLYTSFTFTNFYKINKKRIGEKEKRKCPFGFLKGDK
jgi:hypothetical protein